MTLDVKGWHEREAEIHRSIARTWDAEDGRRTCEERAAFHRDAAEHARKLEEALSLALATLDLLSEGKKAGSVHDYVQSHRGSLVRVDDARELARRALAPEHPVEPKEG